ncbi:hypothetical protein DSCA_43480 [Desulfosarcina alkanivorans]|uniref:YebG family protein n=1 Tax=Desulfosarcina alkanivorans TaxID=571177 RepID=A0A5K7YNN6_9BACT|nr:YebG family protein [Desulfosarcina alkanivorans]BBO70418.1 hypothetical protein DSCA_43480 [Desulfosarcina alkanivorans]
MAVITKYVVVRNGKELDKEFLVKKEAEAYDRMLDAADNLAAFIKDAGLEIDLDNRTIDAISVFLAKNGPEVTRILKGLKPLAPPAHAPDGVKKEPPAAAARKKAPAAKAKPRGK